MKKMGSTDLFNHDIRVKQEPCDELLDEYYYKMIDIKPDVRNIQFLGENSMLQKRNDNQKTELDEIEIELEFVDVKLTTDLLINKKSSDYSRNYLQVTKCSNDYQIQNKIKEETVVEVKKEVNLNFDCELNERNEKMNNSEKLKDGLKIRTKKVRNGTTHTCDTCGKTFARLNNLKHHINSVHDKITHACVICGKKYSEKGTLKKHIDVAHNGVRHACDICGKNFSDKSYLKKHINALHNGVKHECDICGKKYSYKSDLKKHIDSVHNGVTNACDLCEKKFSTKSNLKTHIDSVHNTIIYECDLCEKKFSTKGNLKKHIDEVHNKVLHECVICGKKFSSKSYLKIHMDSVHNGVRHTCVLCGKKYSTKNDLNKHIDIMHNGVIHAEKKYKHLSGLRRQVKSLHNVKRPLSARHAERNSNKKEISEPTSILHTTHAL